MTDWPTIALSVGAGVITTSASLIVASWISRGWLDRQFSDTRGFIYSEAKKLNEKIEENRTKADARHIENLGHFADISIALAANGIRVHRSNGHVGGA